MRKPFSLFANLVILITISKVFEKTEPTTALEYFGFISENGADLNLYDMMTEPDPLFSGKKASQMGMMDVRVFIRAPL